MRKPLPRPRFRRTFIKQWREHRGLNQEQLAERLEMTQSHLSMLENGKRGYTQETLEAIAEALQTDVASLLMRNPLEGDAIWSIWDRAKPSERQMIVDIAKTVTKT
jgi:transcriptional regulator with XRE-family HTH domain